MIGERIRSRLQARQMSQSELARRVKLTQGTIAGLLSGRSRSSAHLHKIAQHLGTTVAYLTGEIDDPDENAPPPLPKPTVQMVMMPVALPSEAALASMFSGLLASMPGLSGDELARELATLLPTALGNLRGPLIEIQQSLPVTRPEGLEVDGDARPARLRA